MPITPAATPLMLGNLLSTGNIGSKTPQLAAGVVGGVSLWAQTVKITAPTTGTLGAGVGLTPLTVPPSVLGNALIQGFAAMGILGPSAPLLIAGLSNGLSQVLAQGIVQTIHTTVGVGAGVASFITPPPGQLILTGMNQAGMVGDGPAKIAQAIGIALTIVFSALTLPVVVAGPPNILPGVGLGIGQII